jgi:hypothetical protein
MEKIYVEANEDLELDVFEGTLEEVIENLKRIVKEFEEKEYKNIRFSWYAEYEYQTVRVDYERLETNAEFEKRRKRIEGKLKKEYGNLEKRKALYEELKKEFEI